MHIDANQSVMPEPRPAPAETCARRVEPTCAQNAGSGFRPLAGSVPFDVFLDGSNRIARETDTFSLRGGAPDAKPNQPEAGSQKAGPSRKTGWAKLGEVLASVKPGSGTPPPAKVAAAPKAETAAVRHTGTGRLIDVIA